MRHFIPFLIVIGGVFQGCFTKPDFPFSPQITFKNARILQPQGIASAQAGDSLSLEITFKDGDGDLGTQDTIPNFFVGIERKRFGIYSPVQFIAGITLNGTFEPLNNQSSPIEGDLRYGVPFSYVFGGTNPTLRKGDTVRFQISIQDRAKNRSNTVQSGDLVLGKYN